MLRKQVLAGPNTRIAPFRVRVYAGRIEIDQESPESPTIDGLLWRSLWSTRLHELPVDTSRKE